MTGPGNVIAHNRVEGFRDCVSLMEDSEAHEQVSIDIIGNDLYRGAADAIAADFARGSGRGARRRTLFGRPQHMWKWARLPSLHRYQRTTTNRLGRPFE